LYGPKCPNALSMEAQMPKFINRPLHDHMPHIDLAEIIVLGVVIGSIALAVGFDWIYRALLS
jgi:hypothetical protein